MPLVETGRSLIILISSQTEVYGGLLAENQLHSDLDLPMVVP